MNTLYQIVLALTLWLLSFTCLSANEIPKLDDDEGFVIVTIYSKGYADKIELNGDGLGDSYTFGPLNYSQHFTIEKMKAGTYQWEKVVNKIGDSSYQTANFEDHELTFTVTAGKLNYVGLFMYEYKGSNFTAKLLNRTSIILTMVKQDFPEYLKAYDVVNGLYPNDPYIPFYLNNSSPVVQGE